MRTMMDPKLLGCVLFGLVLTFAVVDMIFPGFKFAINEQMGGAAAAALRGMAGFVLGYGLYLLISNWTPSR
jgi:hypothetical protein